MPLTASFGAGPGGKRETGENPVRTRHCDWGIHGKASKDAATDREVGKAAGCVDPSARKPAVLLGTGSLLPGHEFLAVSFSGIAFWTVMFVLRRLLLCGAKGFSFAHWARGLVSVPSCVEYF